MLFSTAGRTQDQPHWHSHRLWSRWDMMNFGIAGMATFLRWLWLEERSAGTKRYAPPSYGGSGLAGAHGGGLINALAGPATLSNTLTPEDVKFTKDMLDYGKSFCELMEMKDTLDRMAGFINKLSFNLSFEDFEIELRTLRETVEDGLREKWFYYYPSEKAALLFRVKNDWPKTYEKFPKAKTEIWTGVDCYAASATTAAVFHFMRVAEYGLRAL